MMSNLLPSDRIDPMRIVPAVMFALLIPAAAEAQSFACGESTAGQLSCQAGVACECRWFPASAMEGTPAGWRWDCGILRPRCADNRPASVEDWRDAVPDSLSITDQSVTVGQDNTQIQWTAPAIDF
jgi:hypothetical protein